MKNKWFIVSLLTLLLVTAQGWASTHYNQTVHVKPGENYILYYGTVDFTTDSVGTWYTQAMFIQELTQSNAYIHAFTSNPNIGTEKVDTFIEYSMDRSTWQLSTLNSGAIDGLNDLGAASAADTINIYKASRDPAYAPARWMRFKFVGQTANTKCTLSWWVLFRKGEDFKGSKGESSWYGAMDKI